MGKPKAPKADARIGEAAMLSAQTGQDYLSFMKDQAGVSNQWAAEDRNRYQTVYQPLQDQYIADAATYASPDRMAGRVNSAQASVQSALDAAKAGSMRSLAALGVNPNSGRFAGMSDTADLQGGLAVAGAGNMERRAVRGEAEAMRANAINMGSGLAVNPGTSLGLSNGAASSGFGGAMQGYQQQGSLLNTQHQQQMDAYNANQAQASGMWGGVGSLLGLAFGSDEEIKENKKAPGRSLLSAIEKMRVEEWEYKQGEGDGGRHVGTYAQDFAKETGMGDGKTINVIDAIGTTMGAVKELSAKVDKLASTVTQFSPKRSISNMAEAA